MPAFQRLECWSNLQCAGGARQLVLSELVALTETRSVIGEQSLTATLRFSTTLMSTLLEWKVLRVTYADDTFDEWRIVSLGEGRDSAGAALVVVKALWPEVDLASLGMILRTESDGMVRPDFEALGLTPAQHLSSFILPALSAAGATWFAAGTITPTAPVDVVYAWSTPKAAIDLLATQTGYEFQLRRNGTTQYLIDLIATVGGSASTVLFRAARNLAGLTRQRSAVELVSRVYPKGTNEDGVSATMARARWKVTAVDTGLDDVTLADPVGGDGPILFDDQFNGKYLRRVSGTLDAIVDTFLATQKIRVADASVYAVNDLVEFRADSSGTDLIALDSPAAIALYGAPKVLPVDRPDIPGTVNLCPNPAQRAWAGASSVPADSWAKVGSCTVTQTTTASFWRTGGQSTRVQTAADGVGLEVGNATIVPTTGRPYFSGYVSLQLAAGKVRLELVASDGATTWVIPSGTEQKAWTNVLNGWVDLGISGIDLKALGTGATTVRLRVVQDGAGTADFYVDCAQITQSAGQLPFIEGSGGTQLWQEGNRVLEQQGTPAVRYDVDILDLNRLNPTTWAADALVLGQTVAVYDAELNIVGSTRALEYTRDLLVNADTKAVLSNRPEDLTDEAVRRSRSRRLMRETPLGNPPVVTPFYDRVNGAPYQIQVTLQAVPAGCTIYKWVGLSTDAVPIAGSASYTAYSVPFVVSLDASTTANGVVAAYAVIGGRQSPVGVFTLPLSPQPAAPITLSEPTGGTLRISWAPNAWVRRVAVYRRLTNWPTLDGTSTGTPDPAYRVAEMSVAATGGGIDINGAAIAGGTLLENTGWTNTQVARVVVVPFDELDNVGTQASGSLTMTGAATPALTAMNCSKTSDGTTCSAGAQFTFTWTCNGAVSNALHDLYLFVNQDGGAYSSLGAAITTPTTASPKTGVNSGILNNGAGTAHQCRFGYELRLRSSGAVLDSGYGFGRITLTNDCA
jgi:hypothetical protein